jgi:hypothetical protein
MSKTNVVGLSGNLDVQFDGQQLVRKYIQIFILSQYTRNAGVAVDLRVCSSKTLDLPNRQRGDLHQRSQCVTRSKP